MIRQEDADQFFEEIGAKIAEGIAAGMTPDEAADVAIPRLFYTGHRVIHTFAHPDKRAKWECISCKHQWVSKEGDRCPSCGDCKHVWEWVSEPYGPQDRACKYCGVTLEQDMGSEAFAEYIAREQKS